jgi:hypothetical protein
VNIGHASAPVKKLAGVFANTFCEGSSATATALVGITTTLRIASVATKSPPAAILPIDGMVPLVGLLRRKCLIANRLARQANIDNVEHPARKRPVHHRSGCLPPFYAAGNYEVQAIFQRSPVGNVPLCRSGAGYTLSTQGQRSATEDDSQ